jgi:hypothetical protein
MAVVAGTSFTATLVDPGGLTAGVGARVEAPVTRAIVSYWRAATLAGFLWSVTLDAPLTAGDYNLVWRDVSDPPGYEIFVPLFVADITGPQLTPVTDWPVPDSSQVTPSVDDVAALERTRTIDADGADQSTFTDATRPTVDDVSGLIDQAVAEVLSRLRPSFPATYYAHVRHAAALYAAILVESSYFREQLTEGSVATYRDLFDSAIAGLQSSINIELQDALVGRLV